MISALLLASVTAHALPLPPEAPLAMPPGDHARHVLEFGDRVPEQPRRRNLPLPPPTPGPDMTVYGYQAYWNADLYAVPWDDLTHLAIFSANATPTGGLTHTSRWDDVGTALTLAQPYGVRVHLCVTNFNTDELSTLLGSATYRNALIDELEAWVNATGAHGVNIDFEGLPVSRKQQMVQFTADLQARVGEVVLATPAVDWSGAWDYDELTRYADLFIMGYGYHWAGSGNAGPTDPLYSGPGTVWPAKHSLTWSVDDYLYWGADPNRIILGLPLYGYRYPVATNNVPTPNLGSGSSIFMAAAIANAATYGALYEPTSVSNYYYTGSEQAWYPTVDTIHERIQFVKSAGIAGFGFWALHYDEGDPALWDMIRQETTTPQDPTDTGDPSTDPTDPGPEDTGDPGPIGGSGGFVADAGRPFLAYVGDTVVLSGTGSRGPAGATLQYEWAQVSGPLVKLVDLNSAEPTFQVREPGTHVFELIVGDGERWSEPARSHVVVVDPDAARRHRHGCEHQGGFVAIWPLILLLIRRRPNRSGAGMR